jgi:hypothetical protein
MMSPTMYATRSAHLITKYCRRKSKRINVSRYRKAGATGERKYSCYSLTSALDGGEWLASRPDCSLSPRRDPPGAQWIGGWMGLRTGLDTEATGKILCHCRGSNPGRQVCM